MQVVAHHGGVQGLEAARFVAHGYDVGHQHVVMRGGVQLPGGGMPGARVDQALGRGGHGAPAPPAAVVADDPVEVGERRLRLGLEDGVHVGAPANDAELGQGLLGRDHQLHPGAGGGHQPGPAVRVEGTTLGEDRFVAATGHLTGKAEGGRARAAPHEWGLPRRAVVSEGASRFVGQTGAGLDGGADQADVGGVVGDRVPAHHGHPGQLPHLPLMRHVPRRAMPKALQPSIVFEGYGPVRGRVTRGSGQLVCNGQRRSALCCKVRSCRGARRREMGGFSMVERFSRSRAYLWVPVVLAGAVAVGAAPFTAEHHPPLPPGQTSGFFTLANDSPYAPPGWRTSLALYWLLAGAGAYLLSALVVTRGDRLLGRPVRLQRWTFGLVVLVIGFWGLSPSLARLLHLPVLPPAQIGDLTIRGNQALLCVAAGLMVFGAVRRQSGLLAFAVLFTAVALLANLYDIENQFPAALFPNNSSIWESSEEVNVVVAGLVLLVGAAAGIGWCLWRGGTPSPQGATP
jgi:hypothetical protein